MKVKEQLQEAARWIKDYLSEAHARGIDDLLAYTPYSPHDIQAALQQLIAFSEVEALVPVGATRSNASRHAFHDATHFRLIRETDTAYRWQVHVTESAAPSFVRSQNAALTQNAAIYYNASNWLSVKLPVSA